MRSLKNFKLCYTPFVKSHRKDISVPSADSSAQMVFSGPLKIQREKMRAFFLSRGNEAGQFATASRDSKSRSNCHDWTSHGWYFQRIVHNQVYVCRFACWNNNRDSKGQCQWLNGEEIWTHIDRLVKGGLVSRVLGVLQRGNSLSFSFRMVSDGVADHKVL